MLPSQVTFLFRIDDAFAIWSYVRLVRFIAGKPSWLPAALQHSLVPFFPFIRSWYILKIYKNFLQGLLTI